MIVALLVTQIVAMPLFYFVWQGIRQIRLY